MSIIAIDNCTRPNQIGFGTASDGLNVWAQKHGVANWAVASNKLAVNTAALFNLFILGSLTPANQQIQLRVIPIDTANNGIVARYNSGTQYYYAVLNGGTTLTIGVAPSFSTVASAPFVYSTSTAYWILLQINGTTLSAKAWAEGTAQPPAFACSGTDNTYASGGFGLGCDSSSASNTLFDAFSVTDLVPVTMGDGMGGMFL